MARCRGFVSKGVDNDFARSIFTSVERLRNSTPVISEAARKIENVVVLKDAQSKIPNGFDDIEKAVEGDANIAYGFVSKPSKSIVIIQDNHNRKNIELEGDIIAQGADTVNHEIGHVVDDGLSQSDEFKNAYLADLKTILSILSAYPDAKINDISLVEILKYQKHYLDGVNFTDGIDETDVTRRGLRENFAECFSTIVDSNHSKINGIFAALFPNSMQKTWELIA